MKKYVAFDLEICTELDEKVDWKIQIPLAISCASTVTSDGMMKTWYPNGWQGEPLPREMSSAEIGNLIEYLDFMNELGYTILSWNGLSFDFAVLAAKASKYHEQKCKELAMKHTDMMFHFFCEKGYWVGLNAVAKGLELSGKTEGMSGAQAPELWMGTMLDRLKVLNYVDKDSITTLEVCLKAEEQGYFEWTARSGRLNRFDLPDGWKSVEKSLETPEPDTSWMDEKRTREELMWWLI